MPAVAGEHDGEPIEIGDDAAVDRLVEGIQACLMCQQLPHSDPRLAVLRELGPIGRDPLLVVEPPARMRDRQRHRRQTFRGRVDDDHRVAFPRLARELVADTAQRSTAFSPCNVGATRAAQFPA
jgi:hypothetical protein